MHEDCPTTGGTRQSVGKDGARLQQTEKSNEHVAVSM